MRAVQPYEVQVALWDLDNCLADDKWRTPLIDWTLQGNERYDRYDAQMRKDVPMHLENWNVLLELSTPIFITGRRERWRNLTDDWIKWQLPTVRRDGSVVEEPLILMRPEGDNSKPVDLKKRLLHELRDVHDVAWSRVIAAYDDVPAIIDMYLQHGIPAVHLQVHDPRLAYKAEDL